MVSLYDDSQIDLDMGCIGTQLYVGNGLIFRYKGTQTAPLKSKEMWVLASLDVSMVFLSV